MREERAHWQPGSCAMPLSQLQLFQVVMTWAVSRPLFGHTHKGFRLQCHSTQQRPHNPTIPQWWGYYRSARKQGRSEGEREIEIKQEREQEKENMNKRTLSWTSSGPTGYLCLCKAAKLLTDLSYCFKDSRKEDDCQLFPTLPGTAGL